MSDASQVLSKGFLDCSCFSTQSSLLVTHYLVSSPLSAFLSPAQAPASLLYEVLRSAGQTAGCQSSPPQRQKQTGSQGQRFQRAHRLTPDQASYRRSSPY